MQTTREKIHAQLRSNVVTSEPWKVGSDSAYQREYFVYNVNGGYALTKTRQMRRFGSPASAHAVADQLNLEDQQKVREAAVAFAEKPTEAGMTVTNARGQIGIITESERIRGPYKGDVSVMWVGANYENLCRPEELTRVRIGII